ncbi:HPP family-domain-containing protein [Balamuthia mandrillaris]
MGKTAEEEVMSAQQQTERTPVVGDEEEDQKLILMMECEPIGGDDRSEPGPQEPPKPEELAEEKKVPYDPEILSYEERWWLKRRTREWWHSAKGWIVAYFAALFPSPAQQDRCMEYNLRTFFAKMKGERGFSAGPKLPLPLSTIVLSFVGAFCGILVISMLDRFIFEERDLTFFIMSYCASAALIYGAPHGPLSQPRNLIGGHFISAILGVLLSKFAYSETSRVVVASMSVGLSIAVMQLTNTLHPPGATTVIIPIEHNLKAQWQRMMNKVYNNQQSFPALTGWSENTCVFHPGGSTTKAMTATTDEERNEGEGNKAEDGERPSIVDVTDCIFVHRLADFARLGNASYTYPPSRPRVNLEFVWVYRDGDHRLASLRTRDIYLVPLEASQLVLYRSPPVSMQCLLQYKMKQGEDIVFYFTQPPEAAQQNGFQIKAFTLTSKEAREEDKHGEEFLKLHPPEERISVEGYERSEEGLQFVDCTAEAMFEGKDKENVHPDIRMYKCRVTCPSDVDHTLFCIQYNWYYSMRFLGVPEDAKGYELQAARDPSNVTNLSPVVELSAEERQRFLRSDNMKYNFKDARFQDWIQRNNLAFDPSTETDVDYAYRVLRHIVATVKYTDELEKQGCGMGGVAAGVVDLNTDCGGYSLMFTSTMRYNGIPARLLQGQHANPEIFGLLGALNGGGYVRQKVQESFHCMAEFYSDRLKQWIPVECTNGSERMFGRDRSKPFFTKHYDYIYHLQCESYPPVTSVCTPLSLLFFCFASSSLGSKRKNQRLTL